MSPMTVDVAIPQDLAGEILQQYADILRVGRVRLNGSEVCWSTAGSTSEQLQAFSSAFCGVLRKLPEAYGLEEDTLSHAAFWFCKVVSINYALSDVLNAVKAKFGEGCCIRTSDNAGRTLVEYSVEVLPNRRMRVVMAWREKGNIVFCDPKTAKKKVKGTLSSLVTDFPLPPDPSFVPTYNLFMKVKRSYKQKLLSKVSSLVRKPRHRNHGQSLVPDAPLHSSSSLSATSTCSTEAPPSIYSEDTSADGDIFSHHQHIDSFESTESVPLEMCVSAQWVLERRE